jgi:alanine racemase
VLFAAVVKANAYGHGMEQVSRAALAAGASWLAINTVDEGVRLRAAGFICPILVLGYFPSWEAEKIVANNLTPTINTPEGAMAVASIAATKQVAVNVHVKVDTGLSRFGQPPEDAVVFVQHILSIPHLHFQGLWTHFASADEQDKASTFQQLSVYRDVLKALESRGITVAIKHTANSAATISVPESHYDLVRCGISLYGLYPSSNMARAVQLNPVLALKSRIARTHLLPPGSGISYGHTHITTRPTRVALVPIGYADGLRRGLSNKGKMLVHGQRADILGRVCMDQCVVDIDRIPEVNLDDEVVVIGRQGADEITADEVAGWANTINYEIVTGISARVPRVFLRNGKITTLGEA